MEDSSTEEILEHSIDVALLRPHLECSLCLSLICEPISAGCGHTFCRVCLVKSMRRYRKLCPTCRQVCHISAENAPENIMIKNLAMAVDPAGYAARLVESEAEKVDWSAVYPIFYYNNAMFPGNKLSLMLFEPRYKLMMQRIVNTTRMFAYVPNFDAYHAHVGDFALIAQLRDVEFLADGRSYLDAVLTSRQRIVDHYIEDGTQNLHYCRLEAFRDQDVGPEQTVELQQAVARGRAFLNKLHLQEVERRLGAPPADPESFSLWLTSLAPLSEREKMSLFCSNDTLQRLSVVLEALDRMEERARSNPLNRMRSFISSFFSGIVDGDEVDPVDVVPPIAIPADVERRALIAGTLQQEEMEEADEEASDGQGEDDEEEDDDDSDSMQSLLTSSSDDESGGSSQQPGSSAITQ